MKRVGPELKMPDLKKVKVPRFFADLYQDLVDRRLLPLVALILVAIVAVPILLGESEKTFEPPPPMPGSAGSARASSLTVVEAQPGLRDYRQRLSRRSPTDPFRQRFTGAPASAGLPDEGTSSTSGGEASVTTPSGSGSDEPTSESVPPSSDGGGVPTGELRLFAFAADVKIISTRTTADGKKEKGEPEVRREVVPPAALPSAKTQVVTYMGISPKTGNALLLVSDDVEAIFGEPKCLSGSESCQLLEVDTQLPTTFVYEPTGTRYKINVLKIEPVLRGRYKD
ncbi:MAG TPA: hypothetical protein VF255_00485 [Solirubrobacterales bacterium]